MKNSWKSVNLFDFLIKAMLLFLPFTWALTINIGFPFKFSELFLISILTMIFLIGRVAVPKIGEFKYLGVFVGAILISLVVNFFWSYDYTLSEVSGRFGSKFDSLLKFVYIILATLTFVMVVKAVTRSGPDQYVKFWLYGAFVSALYAFYIFTFSLFDLSPTMLPGHEPQYQSIFIFRVIRNGTFKEGNYMGLYLLISSIIAHQVNRKLMYYFLTAAIITTVSTASIFGAIMFLVLKNLSYLLSKFTLNKLAILFVFVAAVGFGGWSLSDNVYVEKYFVSKFVGSLTKMSSGTDKSRVERTNLTIVASKIFASNPIFGVGISSFSTHYDQYNENNQFEYRDFKIIPNNVYLEVLSEAGLIAFLFWIGFMLSLIKRAKELSRTSYYWGLITIFLSLIAFPTFSMLFIWAFFGLLVGTSENRKISTSPQLF
ncbi:MAG: O-antigen ligase family protein [Cyclobacteriaceae bacterium]